MQRDPLVTKKQHLARSQALYVFGAGGHGKVVADVAIQAGWRVLAVLDENLRLEDRTVGGLPVVSGRERVENLLRTNDSVALAIGNNAIRMRLHRELEDRGIRVQTVISPKAIVSNWATIGNGTVIMHAAIVNAGAVIGDGVILNTAAVVEHDCEIGDFAHVSPNSSLGGAAKIGIGSQVGIGASVLPRVRIGARTIVGAGSVATRDLPDDVIAYGVPARVRRQPPLAEPMDIEGSYKKYSTAGS
jgi:UDP-N-acetylbacillosamine N-acetyltransferase